MRNSTGYLKKILSSYLCSLIVFLQLLTSIYFSPANQTQAQAKEFSINSTILYTITSSTDLTVEMHFNVKKNTPGSTALKSFTVNLPFTSIKNEQVYDSSKKIDTTSHSQITSTDLVMFLDYLNVSDSSDIQFTLYFTAPNYIQISNTEIKKVNLPAAIADIAVDSINFKYPGSLKIPSWTSDSYKILSQSPEETLLSIDKPKTPTFTAIFGKKVPYNFSLKKSISNEEDTTQAFEVNIPRTQYNQIVYFNKINPVPHAAYTDKDGNYYISYEVESKKTLDIEVTGQILISDNTSEANIPFSTKEALIQTSKYWDLDNQDEFNRLGLYFAKNGLTLDKVPTNIYYLKSADQRELFYKLVYQYVIERLSPQKSDNNSFLRAGAQTVLDKTENAIPEDYADLIIAILRKHNVPTRMVSGYVQTISKNTGQKYFHTWVEFWDDDKGWRILDPALEDLTQVPSYGSNQIDHIAMLSKGYDSVRPKPTFYSDAELSFSLAESYSEPTVSTKVNSSFEEPYISDKYLKGMYTITNTGNTIISQIKTNITRNDEVSNFENNNILMPGQSTLIPVSFDISNLVSKSKYDTLVTANLLFTTPQGLSTNEIDSKNVSIQKFWWWDSMVFVLSILIYAVIFTVGYIFIRKWRHKEDEGVKKAKV